MARGHKIIEVTESLFAAGGRHSCLWPEATRFSKSQIPAFAGTDGHYMAAFLYKGTFLYYVIICDFRMPMAANSESCDQKNVVALQQRTVAASGREILSVISRKVLRNM